MTRVSTLLLLALVWVAATGTLDAANLLFGVGLAWVALRLSPKVKVPPTVVLRPHKFVGLVAFFSWQLMLSNLRVLQEVLSPTIKMRPGVVGVPLDAQTDIEITLLATLVTLTPGSVTLDLSPDRRIMYVHAMFLSDPEAFRREVKEGFERRVLELLR